MADPGGVERGAQRREAARQAREQRRRQSASQDAQPLTGDGEVPAGTRRVSRRERLAGRVAVAQGRDHGRERRGPGPRGRERRPAGPRRHSWLRRVGAVLPLLLVGVAVWFLIEIYQPFHGPGHGHVRVTIPLHSTAGQVADRLERQGVVSSAFFFDLRAALAGDRGKIEAGTYNLKLDMRYGDVLKILTTPPRPVPVTEITIIEGRTRQQLDSLLRSEGVSGSYLALTQRSPLLNPTAYGAPAGLNNLEGFLFPSTYQLRKPLRLRDLVADQLKTFKKQFASVNLTYARARHMTAYDVLIIASMVQAEAQTDRDRPLIASVIYNRLAQGMPLQIDATTRYATGNYTSPLTQSQLASSSPYNTRNHPGLPPTPIDNPGLASIQAAAQPAQTNYLYFVVKPCGNGAHVFASTFAQFEQYVAQYEAARARRGGKSPVHC